MIVIDLLNKIANGEEVPKRIKIKDTEYWFNDENKQYIYVPNDEIFSCDDLYSNTLILSYELGYEETLIDFLNTKVEILEEEPRDIEVCGSWFTKSEYDKLFCYKEEKKIPEKLNIELNSGIDENKVNCYRATNLECDLAFKINEIIDYLDYLKSKGE